MNFIKIPANGKRKTKSVRCYFSKQKNRDHILTIKISLDLIEELGFFPGKKVDVFMCEDNPKIWLIKQDKNSNSFTLSKKFPKTHFVTIVFKFDYIELPDNPTKMKELKYDFYDGGLRIYYEDN